MIPTASNFPTSLDTDDNLFEVHDSLRIRLAEDYSIGDTKVTIEGEATVMEIFPDSGFITLTEQCSDIDDRALSFFYASKTTTTFNGLILLPGFIDSAKPKKLTNVTRNIMANDHNHIKNALIAIQTFIGIQGTTDVKPLGSTMEGRINFLHKLVLTPKAWFTADKTVGLVPLEITFTDQSFRLGKICTDDPVVFIWDFGDQTTSIISTISIISGISVITTSGLPTVTAISVVETSDPNIIVQDLDGGSIKKTYNVAGKYDVKLTVRNKFGEDMVTFEEMVKARIEAPDEAQINFVPRSTQNTSVGDATPLFDRLGTKAGGPFLIPPTLRSLTNTFIDMEIPEGQISPGRSFGGEELNASNTPIDPITSYTWSLGDDLVHESLDAARASYSIGGVYDLTLRVDTDFGAYRITTYENSIDIIERTNLWLFTTSSSSIAKGHEFGLISETFKTATKTHSIIRDDSFLTGTGDETRAKREFKKNTGFAPRTISGSGEQGTTLLFWAGGGTAITPLASQEVKMVEYKGFEGVLRERGTR